MYRLEALKPQPRPQPRREAKGIFGRTLAALGVITRTPSGGARMEVSLEELVGVLKELYGSGEVEYPKPFFIR